MPCQSDSSGILSESNDWFYAFDTDGIHLFDGNKPISGDFTSKVILYDVGSEKDEEIGIGRTVDRVRKPPTPARMRMALYTR